MIIKTSEHPSSPMLEDLEFPIVSSSSSMLEEPVWVSEEPHEQSEHEQSEDIFLRSIIALLRLMGQPH